MQADILLETNRKILASFCQKNHIIKLSLFGSALRGEATAQSDIDLLVEFHPEHIPGLITLSGMEIELSNLLGKKVDLRTAQDLSPYFRDEVLAEAQDAYALRRALEDGENSGLVEYSINGLTEELDKERVR